MCIHLVKNKSFFVAVSCGDLGLMWRCVWCRYCVTVPSLEVHVGQDTAWAQTRPAQYILKIAFFLLFIICYYAYFSMDHIFIVIDYLHNFFCFLFIIIAILAFFILIRFFYYCYFYLSLSLTLFYYLSLLAFLLCSIIVLIIIYIWWMILSILLFILLLNIFIIMYFHSLN